MIGGYILYYHEITSTSVIQIPATPTATSLLAACQENEVVPQGKNVSCLTLFYMGCVQRPSPLPLLGP